MYKKECFSDIKPSSSSSSYYRLLFFVLISFLTACTSSNSDTPPVGSTLTNNAPTASNVSIVDSNGGQVVVGDILSASYTYADDENDAEGGTTFVWLRNGSAISGATAATYTLVTADSGQSISLQVTPVASSGEATGTAVTSTAINVTVIVSNDAPLASNVSITDDNGDSVIVGDSLTGAYSYSDTEGDAEGVTTFRWLRDGVAISGATASTYTLVSADSGSAISFEVTPVAATGEATGAAVTSASLTVINLSPRANNISITDNNGGIVEVGDVLTGSYTYFDNDSDAEGATTFAWLHSDGQFNTVIPGATASTYTLTQADSGKTVLFAVTPVAVSGVNTGRQYYDFFSGVFVPNDAPVASNVSITDVNGGAAVVGDTLTGTYTYSDTEGDVEGSSTFRWLNSGFAISGATSSSYTLQANDVARLITFEVTPVAVTGVTNGSAVLSPALATGTPPVVKGFARYLDVNKNGINDAGDVIRLPFDQMVSVNSAAASDFNLPVSGDDLGTGASVSAGPQLGEITITLGTSPSLKTRQAFASLSTANQPSGIDVSVSPGADVLESSSGIDAQASSPVDIVPGYVLAQTLTAGGSYSVALGDIDEDGDLDAVIANKFSQPNKVYINDGSGNYTDSGQSLGAYDSGAVALGDVDGDGDLDIVIANDGEMHRIYSNDGNGVFTDSGQRLGIVNNNANAMALADMDGDGDLDIIVTHDFGYATQYFIGNGSGAFSLSPVNSLGFDGNDIAVGDVDGDGDTDVLIAFSGNNGTANIVFLNDGSGGFTDSGERLGASMTNGVALGDIDGDGDLDAVGVNAWPLANHVYVNDGNGGFTDSGQSLGGDSRSNGVALQDMDADGDLDMVVANYDSKPNRVYLNDGSGLFSDSGQAVIPSFNDSKSVAIGDVDADGDLDLLFATNGRGNHVYLNSLTGTWGEANYSDTAQALGSADSRSVALGDIDGDGDLDKIVANYNQPNKIYINDGTGVYTDSTQTLGSGNSLAVTLGDVDGDGDLDMAVANNAQANLLYLNNGSGTFTDSGQTLGTSASYAIALADTDGDGDLDMIVGNNGQANRVYTNNGSGVFSDAGQTLGTNSTTSIDIGDIDGDGDLDMVVGNNGSANLVYKNTVGNFTNSTNSLGTGATQSVTLGDVDGDGDLDIAVVNDGQANRVYFNDGQGNFTDSTQTLGTAASRSVALRDVDGDGDLDMAVANTNGQANKIYSNNGSGVFSDSGRVFAVNKSNGLALGDIDNDGDLDMVVVNDTNTANQVYRNQ